MQCCIEFRCSERSTTVIGRRGSQHLHRRTTEGAVVGRGRQGGETRAVAPVPPVLGAVLGQGREQGLTFSHFFLFRQFWKEFFYLGLLDNVRGCVNLVLQR